MSKSIDSAPLEHPPGSVLEDFVSGALFAAERALLEAHLHRCQTCRGQIGVLAQAGSSFLQSQGPEARIPGIRKPGPKPEHALANLWERIESALPDPSLSDPAEAMADPFGDLPVPRACRDELELTDPLQWEPLGPIQVCRLVESANDNYVLFLLDSPPGATFPHHRHLGQEDLVILQGGLTDDFGHMGLGDFRSYAPGTEHAPVIDSDRRCVALAVVRAGLDFG